MAGGDDAGPAPRLSRRARQRQKELVDYMCQHREQLEKVAQECVNRVLLDRPSDPYEAMLAQLSGHTLAGLSFSQVRVWPQGSDAICCEVVADARGSSIAVHQAELPRTLIVQGLAAGDAFAGSETGEGISAQVAAVQLGKTVRGLLSGVEVLNFPELHQRLRNAISPNGALGGEDAAAALRGVLGSLLLGAASRLLDRSVVDAVRDGLALRGNNLATALPEDLEAWHQQWPELMLPALQGGTQRRRLCVGVTLWAATLPDVAASSGLEPVPVETADAAGPSGAWLPGNSVAVAGGLGSALAAKVAADGPAIPDGEDFHAALGLFRKALDAVIQDYSALHPAAAAAAGDAPGSGPEVSAAPQEPPAQPAAETGSLAEQRRRGCVYCALHLDADAAFNPETQRYAFAEGAERTQEELVEHYAGLCRAEPLLRALIAPFSPRDEARAAGLAALRSQLPPEVVIFEDTTGKGGTRSGAAASKEAGSQDDGVGGYVRDLGLTALGLIVQCERRGRLYAGREGLYDFSAGPGHLPMIASFMDASRALPECGRRFLLPRGGDAGELASQLQPLDSYVCSLLTAAPRQWAAADKQDA